MKPFIPLLVPFVLLFFSLSSCKKEANEIDGAPLQFPETSYRPLEYACISIAGQSLSKDQYTAVIDNEYAVNIYKVGDFLVFQIPELGEGQHQWRSYLNGIDFKATYIEEGPIHISDHSRYLNEYKARLSSKLDDLENLPANIDSVSFRQDIQLLRTYFQLAEQALVNGSLAEKEEAARMLMANSWWMDEIHISPYNLSNYQAPSLHEDYLEQAIESQFNYYNSRKNSIQKHFPKLIAWVKEGLAAPASSGLNISAQFALSNGYSDFMSCTWLHNDFMQTAFIPHQLYLSEIDASTGLPLPISTSVQMQKAQTKTFQHSLSYRSPYQLDQESELPICQSLEQASSNLTQLFSIWNDLFPQNFNCPPLALEQQQSFQEKRRLFDSEYIRTVFPGNQISSYFIDLTDSSLQLAIYGHFNNTVTNEQLEIQYQSPILGQASSSISIEIAPQLEQFTDPRDGEVYDVIQLKNMTWFAQNLRYNAAGSSLPPNNSGPEYGRLYDWNTAMTACPPGWRLPSDLEWTELEKIHSPRFRSQLDWLGPGWRSDHAPAMRSLSWAPTAPANDSYNFNALPLNTNATILYASFWSSSDNNSSKAFTRNISSSFYYSVQRDEVDKSLVASCRCLQD
ncbi:FISUMP domain-containing protein [Saprospira sp. CCB-QB6]|uniref:FISUMP domain-containing protein n=1 Tax=Saprospira sp. CCB-QB6 TaxID=3023936 RepID=UPI00234B6762|nr:FISUMP domain-containing protein [Saprospira sp. CCB-QB6]WCL81856.1 FISUMP domain-containing protein [Saprospira sp. CCB-QB6]